MIGDWLWDFATSTMVLAAIGALSIAALIVAHVPFGKYMPVIAPYVALAKVVSIVAPMGLTFLVGFRVSDERAALANLKSQLAAVEQDRGNARKAAADAALRGAAIEANAAVEKESTDAYIRDLESRPNTACALTDDDLRGMRAIRPGDAGSRPSGKAGLHGAGRGAGAAAR